jgi:hypothetical protein
MPQLEKDIEEEIKYCLYLDPKTEHIFQKPHKCILLNKVCVASGPGPILQDYFPEKAEECSNYKISEE